MRHNMLAEAIHIMRELWLGDFVTVRGRHFDADHARIHDLPESPIDVVVAVSGESSLDLASAAAADGVMAVDPEPDLVAGWTKRRGTVSETWTEVPFAWAPDDQQGREFARRFRFGALGWDVMSELPNPKRFDAATSALTDDQITSSIPFGPDPSRYVDAMRSFLDAGFEHVAIVPVGDDIAGTLDFWEREVRPALDG